VQKSKKFTGGLKMKKFTVMLLVVVIAVMSIVAFAGAATKEDVIEKLEDSNIAEVYVTQAESYLNSVTVTSTQADQIIAYINSINATVGDKTKLSELTLEQKKSILADFVAAGVVMGLTVSADVNGNIEITNDAGQVVFSVNNANIIKQTGLNYNMTYIGLSLLLISAIAAVGVRKAFKKSR